MKIKLEWELIDAIRIQKIFTNRVKVQNGWIVMLSTPKGESITFVPDPKHKWEIE